MGKEFRARSPGSRLSRSGKGRAVESGMQRLRGGDAVYLYQETPSAPQHTLKISILKLKDPVPDRKLAGEYLGATIHRIPALRWRILPVPFGLHHPVAVEDPDFDLESHLNYAALPSPGTMRELDEMVAQIASHPLDRNRPLWEVWVIEGLSDNRVAVVMKAHHAIADGMASIHLFSRMLSPMAEGEEIPEWRPRPLPSRGRLLLSALGDHIRLDARGFPRFMRTVLRRMKAARLHRERSDRPVVNPLEDKIPPSRFNGALSTRRRFATLSLPLERVRSVKSALNGTVNDVVLALVAGALRRYMLDHGEIPTDPLISIIPVSADEPGTERIFGNNIAIMGSRLHVDLADPLQRFSETQQSTLAGKRHLEVFGKSTLPEISQYLLPAVVSYPRHREYRLAAADSADYKFPCQVAVSNVPGPRNPLATDYAELDALYSVGPLQEGNGLNITVWSYCDQLNFSVISCKKRVPDPHAITDGIRKELETLAGLSIADGGGARYG